MRGVLISAAILGALGVILGAFGAHALRSRLDISDFKIFETAVHYLQFTALALLALPASLKYVNERSLLVIWKLWLFGIFVFAGSLFLLIGTGAKWWGAVTPIGGASLIAGWIWLAVCLVKTGVKNEAI